MSGTFRLAVLTPKATVFDGVVETVTASGYDGEFGVLPGHYAYITSVRPGVLSFNSGDQDHVYAIGHGFVQVSAERVSIVVSSCEDAGSVDVEAAQELVEQAEKVLLEVGPGGEGYTDALVDQEMALGRIVAAGHAPGE